MTCFPVSTHVSITIYMLELEKKSPVTVAFTLFFKRSANIFIRKISILCAHRLLLSIQYPNVEEIYINVLVLFVLKKLPIAFWSVLSLNNLLDILLID